MSLLYEAPETPSWDPPEAPAPAAPTVWGNVPPLVKQAVVMLGVSVAGGLLVRAVEPPPPPPPTPVVVRVELPPAAAPPAPSPTPSTVPTWVPLTQDATPVVSASPDAVPEQTRGGLLGFLDSVAGHGWRP